MATYRQDTAGAWVPAEPVPPTRLLRFERWLRAHRLAPLASALARFDERGLG